MAQRLTLWFKMETVSPKWRLWACRGERGWFTDQHAPSHHPKPSALGHHGAFSWRIPQHLALAAVFKVAPVKRGAQLTGRGKAPAAAALLTPQSTGPCLLTPVLWRSELTFLSTAASLQEETSRWRRDHQLPVQVTGSPLLAGQPGWLFLHVCPCRSQGYRKGRQGRDAARHGWACFWCQPLQVPGSFQPAKDRSPLGRDGEGGSVPPAVPVRGWTINPALSRDTKCTPKL